MKDYEKTEMAPEDGRQGGPEQAAGSPEEYETDPTMAPEGGARQSNTGDRAAGIAKKPIPRAVLIGVPAAVVVVALVLTLLRGGPDRREPSPPSPPTPPQAPAQSAVVQTSEEDDTKPTPSGTKEHGEQPAQAAEPGPVDPGLNYEIVEDHVEILGYNGEQTSVEIPAEISDLPVTVITTANSDNRSGFSESMQYITIPDSVTTLGDYVFAGCSGLLSVTIPDSVTSIGGSAFAGCTSLLTIYIPGHLTFFGERSFEECRALTDVYFAGEEELLMELDTRGAETKQPSLFPPTAQVHFSYVY